MSGNRPANHWKEKLQIFCGQGQNRTGNTRLSGRCIAKNTVNSTHSAHFFHLKSVQVLAELLADDLSHTE
jgi:hypothetical protein